MHEVINLLDVNLSGSVDRFGASLAHIIWTLYHKTI